MRSAQRRLAAGQEWRRELDPSQARCARPLRHIGKRLPGTWPSPPGRRPRRCMPPSTIQTPCCSTCAISIKCGRGRERGRTAISRVATKKLAQARIAKMGAQRAPKGFERPDAHAARQYSQNQPVAPNPRGRFSPLRETYPARCRGCLSIRGRNRDSRRPPTRPAKSAIASADRAVSAKRSRRSDGLQTWRARTSAGRSVKWSSSDAPAAPKNLVEDPTHREHRRSGVDRCAGHRLSLASSRLERRARSASVTASPRPASAIAQERPAIPAPIDENPLLAHR